MPTCLEVFCECGLEGKSLQIHIDQCFPGFACELEPCSPHSPGPVNDNEEVAFLLINPLHYDAQRDVVVPSAFQELTNRDLSVLRLGHATKAEAVSVRDELIERGLDRVPPQMRLVEEVCIGSVSDLRSEVEPHGRLLGVFDTALQDKVSHASLFTTGAVHANGRLRKVVRQRVHDVMTKRRTPFPEFLQSLP